MSSPDRVLFVDLTALVRPVSPAMDASSGDLKVDARCVEARGGGVGRRTLRIRLERRTGAPDRTEEVMDALLFNRIVCVHAHASSAFTFA